MHLDVSRRDTAVELVAMLVWWKPARLRSAM